MNDPKNFYKKKTLVDYLGSVKPESQSVISESSLLNLSQEFAEYSIREKQRRLQWRKDELTRRYTQNQQKLLSYIKGMLKDFEGYQLLLQSDSYRKLQQLVEDIENVPEFSPEQEINSAYLDALRYGLGRMKSP